MTEHIAQPTAQAGAARKTGKATLNRLVVLFSFYGKCLRALPLLPLATLAGCGDPLIQEAENAVRAQLRDPDSATFSEVQRCGTSDVLMGKVNSKNAYGGYAGKENFYYANGQADLGFSTNLHQRCMAAIQAQTRSIRAKLSPEARARLEREEAEDAAKYGVALDGSTVASTADNLLVAADPRGSSATEASDTATAEGLYDAADEAAADGDEGAATALRNAANNQVGVE